MLRSLFLVTSVIACVGTTIAADREIRFNRDVRPILTDKCFACHGPDAETVEGDLRLDLRDEAVADGSAIVVGKPNESELIRRIASDDEYEVMPPPELHKPVTKDELQTLKYWIAQGAAYESHWAYQPMAKPAVSVPAGGDRVATLIDMLVQRRLDEENVTPVSQADPVTLIRRLHFDLNGLPPEPKDLHAYTLSSFSDAYSDVVDRLLASPHFGERMAIYWLDLVRYADTVGYHGDQNVSQSPYRDYVIDAFNSNMPYDQFVREQIAGDLIENATLRQQVASGYNRLNQTTEEGGSQAKEYLAIYFADRVRNVSQVFMGSTVGCAQCHDHKYDPFTTKDFYSLGAFFADLDERGVYGARKREPSIPVPTAQQARQLAELDCKAEAAKANFETAKQTLVAGQAAWEVTARANLIENQPVEHSIIDDVFPEGAKKSGDWKFVDTKKGPVLHGKKSRLQKANGLVQHYADQLPKPVTIGVQTVFYSWVHLDSENPPKSVMLQFNDGDWNQRAVWGEDKIEYGRRDQDWAGYQRFGALPTGGDWFRLEVPAAKVGLKPGDTVRGFAFTQFGGTVHWDASGVITNSAIPQNILESIAINSQDRSTEQAVAVTDFSSRKRTRKKLCKLNWTESPNNVRRSTMKSREPSSVAASSHVKSGFCRVETGWTTAATSFSPQCRSFWV